MDRYIHGARGIHAQHDGTAWQWMTQDGLGSVRGLSDSSGTVAMRQDYEPFGIPYNLTGTPETAYAFTGEDYDATDALLYLRARHYAPALGIFASLDPFEGMAVRPMSLNGYSWVEGNVVNAGDPSGMQASTCLFGQGECQVIRENANRFLDTARRINVQRLTNMNDEAFAVMIAAKFVVEDATHMSDPPDVADEIASAVGASGRANASNTFRQLFTPIPHPLSPLAQRKGSQTPRKVPLHASGEGFREGLKWQLKAIPF